MRLLKSAPLRKISVTKICEDAQINRVTFYKHYSDTFDLYEKMVAELIDDSAGELVRVFETQSLRDAIRSVFQTIRENPDKFGLLFSENVDSFYRTQSIELCVRKLSQIDIAIPGIDETQYVWLKKFLSSGGCGVLFSWLQSGMKQEPAEVADTLYHFISRLMKTYSVEI